VAKGRHRGRSWLPGCVVEQGVKGGNYFWGQGCEAGGKVRESVGIHGGRRFGPVFNSNVGFDVALRTNPMFSR
jgi:hypothetical protein